MPCYVLAKYGDISHLATFRTPLGDLRRGERVVVRTERGTEIATVVQPAFEAENGVVDKSSGEVLRRINSDDLVRINQIESVDRMAEMKFCRERITSHNLPMKLVDIEHIFGSEKIIFYFLADGRVDFRQLVKDLAKEYRTRIELKQIGVRDEARLLADYDHCGREICCRTFIRDLQPVTMKMAKAQKATLDPSKISGRCGRLMCCLRYEDKVYDELKRMLPRKGATVVTERGKAEVIDYDIISQTLRVENAEGRIVKVSMKEVKQVIPRDEKEFQRRQQERSQRVQQARVQGAQTAEPQKPGDRPRRSKRRRRRGGKDRTPDAGMTPAPDAAQSPPAPDAPTNAPAPDAPADRSDGPTDSTPGDTAPDTGPPQQG